LYFTTLNIFSKEDEVSTSPIFIIALYKKS